MDYKNNEFNKEVTDNAVSKYDWWGVAKVVYRETRRHDKIETKENSDEKNEEIKKIFEKVSRFGKIKFNKKEFNVEDYETEEVGNFLAYYYFIKESLELKQGFKSNRGLENNIVEEQDINYEVISKLMLIMMGECNNWVECMKNLKTYTLKWNTIKYTVINEKKLLIADNGINKKKYIDEFFDNSILDKIKKEYVLKVSRNYVFFQIMYCQCYSSILDYQIKNMVDCFLIQNKKPVSFYHNDQKDIHMYSAEDENSHMYKMNVVEQFAVMNGVKMLRKQNEVIIDILESLKTTEITYKTLEIDTKVKYKRISEYSNYELSKLLNGSNEDKRMKSHREVVLSVMEWLSDSDGWYFQKESFKDFKIIYDEIYKDKTMYRGEKASTTVKKIVSWEKRMESEHDVFLREKIWRGSILQRYSFDEYVQICDILINWYSALKEIYQNPDLNYIINGYKRLNDQLKNKMYHLFIMN